MERPKSEAPEERNQNFLAKDEQEAASRAAVEQSSPLVKLAESSVYRGREGVHQLDTAEDLSTSPPKAYQDPPEAASYATVTSTTVNERQRPPHDSSTASSSSRSPSLYDLTHSSPEYPPASQSRENLRRIAASNLATVENYPAPYSGKQNSLLQQPSIPYWQPGIEQGAADGLANPEFTLAASSIGKQLTENPIPTSTESFIKLSCQKHDNTLAGFPLANRSSFQNTSSSFYSVPVSGPNEESAGTALQLWRCPQFPRLGDKSEPAAGTKQKPNQSPNESRREDFEEEIQDPRSTLNPASVRRLSAWEPSNAQTNEKFGNLKPSASQTQERTHFQGVALVPPDPGSSLSTHPTEISHQLHKRPSNPAAPQPQSNGNPESPKTPNQHSDNTSRYPSVSGPNPLINSLQSSPQYYQTRTPQYPRDRIHLPRRRAPSRYPSHPSLLAIPQFQPFNQAFPQGPLSHFRPFVSNAFSPLGFQPPFPQGPLINRPLQIDYPIPPTRGLHQNFHPQIALPIALPPAHQPSPQSQPPQPSPLYPVTMPPGGGHYRPNTGSNPYNNFHGPSTQQAFQQPNSNFHSQGFGGHPGFTNNHSNGSANIFPGGLANGSNFGSAGGLGSMGATGLASQEAQLRFAHGASLQQQQIHDGIGATALLGKSSRIREVWSHNLAAEIATIRELVDRYPYVSMDTEFPGVVGRPMGDFTSKADYHYQTLRVNVDMCKLIRIGLTLFSPEGDLPPAQSDMALRSSYTSNLTMTPCTWMLNFKYNVDKDMGGEANINLLKDKGVDFDKCAEIGIDHAEFGSVLQTSGLTTNDDVYWISFHSGYDFGYLLKAMQPSMMPNTEEGFIDNIKEQFPNIWDVKFLFKQAQALAQGRTSNPEFVLSNQATNILNVLASANKSSLQDIAEELGLGRDGPRSTAGSDSMLTGLVFWQMKQKIFGGEIDPSLMGGIWGLSLVGQPASAEARTALFGGHQTPGSNGLTQAIAGLSKGDGGPGTPLSTHGNLASTPGPHGQGYAGNIGNISSGGAFGNFQYRQ